MDCRMYSSALRLVRVPAMEPMALSSGPMVPVVPGVRNRVADAARRHERGGNALGGSRTMTIRNGDYLAEG